MTANREFSQYEFIDKLMNKVDSLSSEWQSTVMDDFRGRVAAVDADHCIDGTCTDKIIEETEVEVATVINSTLKDLTQIVEQGWTETKSAFSTGIDKLVECTGECEEEPMCTDEMLEEYLQLLEEQRILEEKIEVLEAKLEQLEAERVKLIAQCPHIAELDRQLW